MLINFMKAQEMIAGYLFFVFSAILCSARDGNIESSSGLSKSQLCAEFSMHLGPIFLFLFFTHRYKDFPYQWLTGQSGNSAAGNRENTENSRLDNILQSVNTASAILLEEVYSVIEQDAVSAGLIRSTVRLNKRLGFDCSWLNSSM